MGKINDLGVVSERMGVHSPEVDRAGMLHSDFQEIEGPLVKFNQDKY